MASEMTSEKMAKLLKEKLTETELLSLQELLDEDSMGLWEHVSRVACELRPDLFTEMRSAEDPCDPDIAEVDDG